MIIKKGDTLEDKTVLGTACAAGEENKLVGISEVTILFRG